jgi:hypothetical protein
MGDVKKRVYWAMHGALVEMKKKGDMEGTTTMAEMMLQVPFAASLAFRGGPR